VVGTGSIWLRIGTSEGGNEPSGSIKRWEVLEWLHNWQLDHSNYTWRRVQVMKLLIM
jgi:hypothetical protein